MEPPNESLLVNESLLGNTTVATQHHRFTVLRCCLFFVALCATVGLVSELGTFYNRWVPSEKSWRIKRVPQEARKPTWSTAEFEIFNNPDAVSLFRNFVASQASTLPAKEQAKKALITEIGKLFERGYAEIRSTVNNLLAHRAIFVGSTQANILPLQPKKAM